MLPVSLLDFEYFGLLIQHVRLYVIPVRRASDLLSASFRFRLTTDTLAELLAVLTTEPAGVFHSLVSAPCRAHQKLRAACYDRPYKNVLVVPYLCEGFLVSNTSK